MGMLSICVVRTVKADESGGIEPDRPIPDSDNSTDRCRQLDIGPANA